MPSLRRLSISAHSSWRTCGSRPTVGSSRSSSCGRCTRARAMSSRRRMPPESLSTRVVAAVAQVGEVERPLDRGRALRARDAVEVREDEQVLLGRQRHVEVVELRDDAALRARRLRVAGQHVPEDLELALVGDRLRGEHLHRRRLAGAVGAEQADARPLGDVEVEAGDGGDLPVALDDAAQADGGTPGHDPDRSEPGGHGEVRLPPALNGSVVLRAWDHALWRQAAYGTRGRPRA